MPASPALLHSPKKGPDSAIALQTDGQVAQLIATRDQRPLGQILLEDGAVDPRHLTRALVMRQRQAVPLGEILLARGWVDEQALTRALCRQWRTNSVDLAAMPPDPRLLDHLGADFCLAAGLVPWRRIGGVTFIATSRPKEFARQIAGFPPGFGQIRMLLCSETAMREAILASRQTALIRHAESRVPEQESCRTSNTRRNTRIAILLVAALLAGFMLAPIWLFAALTSWAVLTLGATMALKTAAFMATLRHHRIQHEEHAKIAAGHVTPPEMTDPLPVISVMVPLFAEADIAGRLIERLSQLTYPRELTDLLLVIEENDKITCDAIDRATLPRWIRVVRVPAGPIQTKPRALNYALNFCRGQIIGVWDAEDRPDPDQLHKVARHFHFAPPEVACVQGILDYYNPRTNWLARCFTIEYASWFRANLLGVAKMGLVVPLGGTTLFFRRPALEAVGCWDAFNVTEDADLGVRLARHGWRTEMIDTTTHEEANCHALPWIKQRSRWLKGYAMTWAVHMRNPRILWRDLGGRRFIAFQIQFLGAISQYLLAPVLWSFWLLTLGLPHPLREPLGTVWGGNAIPALFVLFVTSELLTIGIGVWAVRSSRHRHLMSWVPTLHFYFPLGCLAGWKAIYEVVTMPFYWDKTAHGLYDAQPEQMTPGPDTDAAAKDNRPQAGLTELHLRNATAQPSATAKPPLEPVEVLGRIS